MRYLIVIYLMAFGFVIGASSAEAQGIYGSEVVQNTSNLGSTQIGTNVHHCNNSYQTSIDSINNVFCPSQPAAAQAYCYASDETTGTINCTAIQGGGTSNTYNTFMTVGACPDDYLPNTFDDNTCLPQPDENNQCTSGYVSAFGQCEPEATENECHSGGYYYTENGGGEGYCTFDGSYADSGYQADPETNGLPEECSEGYCSWPEDSQSSCEAVGGSFGQINGQNACVSDGDYCTSNPSDPLCGDGTDETQTDTDTTVTDNGDGTTTTTTNSTQCNSLGVCVETTTSETCDDLGNCTYSSTEDGSTYTAGDCDSQTSCIGDAIQCAIAAQQIEIYCAEKESLEAIPTDMQNEFSNLGLTHDLENLTEGELFDELNTEGDIDLESELGDFLNEPLTVASCPAAESVSLSFVALEFSYDLYCDLAVHIRPIVILASFVAAGFIVLRSFAGTT